jgi:superfamily I DNA/RNA helicase/mRNA-degrading endonuclease RelE of RelBE toxin-antitoxin system
MDALANTITLVLGSDFLSSFADLPKKIQLKVDKFISGYRENPTASSYNYESLHSRDPHLRSVRIDHDYRGIIYKPDTGSHYILVTVAKHDDAYTWAEHKVFSVHPDTGALQIIDYGQLGADSYDAQVAAYSEADAEEKRDLFQAYRDRELEKIGIPKVMIPFVRQITTEEELEQAEGMLPQEAWEALYLLQSGESLQNVYNEITVRAEAAAAGTIDEALQQPDSQRRFFIITDDEALKGVLLHPLDFWRVFLHPTQRSIVEMQARGPVRVLGGPGTGKTVVAMHRAKWLIEHIFTSTEEKILFTTFTKNLAADIKDNLSRICTQEQLRRIEVVNIDSWVAEFLRRRSYHYRYISEGRRREFWDEALNEAPREEDFPRQFYLDEWEQVIQQQGISTLKGYLQANRTGRGRSLRIQQRKAIWPIFAHYRQLLDDQHAYEFADAARSVTRILRESGAILPYKSIVIDEAQDLDAVTFSLLREIVKEGSDGRGNDLFITGDAHQRIYGRPLVLSHCGINIVGRGRRLRVNYRTPEEVRSWAMQLLRGEMFDDLEGGTDSLDGYHSVLHGEDPVIKHFATYSEEIEYITGYIDELLNGEEAPEAICIALRTNDLVSRYIGAIEYSGKQLYQITVHDERKKPGIRIATMHRVKGLEFNHMICPGVNDGVLPHKYALEQQDNEQAREQFIIQERSLFSVAVTRARKSVLISSYGRKSTFL